MEMIRGREEVHCKFDARLSWLRGRGSCSKPTSPKRATDGPTNRSWRRSTRASPTSRGPGSGSSRRASRTACHGNPKSARPMTFDGEAEARLIALTCSAPPESHAKWSLRLLEEKVVELKIVERASDSTIGRTLKKHPQAAPEPAVGDPTGGQRRVRRRDGGCAGGLLPSTRPGTAHCLPRRDLEATDRRDARPRARRAGPSGPLRLRIRAQRNRQPVHGLRPA